MKPIFALKSSCHQTSFSIWILTCIFTIVCSIVFVPSQKLFAQKPNFYGSSPAKNKGGFEGRTPQYGAPYGGGNNPLNPKGQKGTTSSSAAGAQNSAQNSAESDVESLGFLGQVSMGYTLGQLVFPRPNPDQGTPKCELVAGSDGCRTQQPSTILFSALAGLRSRNVSQFFFISYYKYSLFWDVETGKNTSFADFFQSPKSTTSPLPTRGLLRVHEWTSDVRYLHEYFRLGAQFQLALGRQNSTLFAQEGEVARNYFSSELFLPYIILMYENLWRLRFYFPLYTVVNYDDDSFTSTTLSLSPKGRGYVASAGVNNNFFFPELWLTSGIDFSYMDYKFKSVGNDRSRYGGALRANFTPPFFAGAWIEPKISYYRERYYVPTAIIPGYEDDNRTSNGAISVNRLDGIIKLGAKIGYDFLGSHRLDFESSIERKNSNVYTYSSQKISILINYRWVFPNLNQVIRYVKSTERDPSNGTFEGEGG